jgi:multicomponent Na+:H+ antiporter subunit C
MSWSLALTAAALAGIGTWLAMDRSLTRILLGLGLWGHAAVLLLLVAGGRAGRSPVGSADELAGAEVSDPLVQALSLTAIVITFAVTAFLLALAARSWQLTGDDTVRDDLEDARVARAEDDDLPDTRAAVADPPAGRGGDAPGAVGGRP